MFQDVGVDVEVDFTGGGGGTIGTLVDSIDKQVAEGECISVLAIAAHGNPLGLTVGSENTKKKTHTVRTGPIEGQTEICEKNADDVADEIIKKSRFCEECTIYLLSCNTGLGSMPQSLADSTGCTVKAPKGYCYPNLKNPEKSRIVPEEKKTWNPATWFAQTFGAFDGADDTFGTFTPDGQGPPSFPAEGCPCKKKKGKK